MRLKFVSTIDHHSILKFLSAFIFAFIVLNAADLPNQYYKNQLWLTWSHALIGVDVTKNFLEWESVLSPARIEMLRDRIDRATSYGTAPYAHRISGYLFFIEDNQKLALEEWEKGYVPSSDLIAWGQLAMDLEAYDYAERWLGYATLYDKTRSTPWYLLGKIYIYQMDWEKAMTAFETAVQNNNFTIIDTKLSDVYWELGNLYRDHATLPNWPLILQTYEAALTANQFSTSWSEAQAHFLLGYAKWQTNNPQAAITYMQEAIKIHPIHYQAHIWLGMVYFETYHDVQKTEALWQTAVQIDPQNMQAYRLLRDLYNQQEKWTQAANMYTAILNIEPKNQYAQSQLAIIRGH